MGSVVHFITLVGVSDGDQGKYTCKVIDVLFSHVNTEDSIDVNIYSYPANMYPLCTSISNQPITLSVGETLTLKCTSEKGIPNIEMKWLNTKSFRYISSPNTTDGNLIHSETIIRIDDALQNVVFRCEISNKGFPDWKRTCSIGPILVNSNPSVKQNNGMTTNIVGGNKETRGQNDMLKPRLIGACGTCSSNDEILQFYLTIAVIGTGILTIVFLTTTMILCYKYQRISNVTRREPTRVLTPQQSIEPVYVSLQRRSVNADREYMTLEDPNNPDNKIILPKETFDDYCRTMTLKRV